MPTVKELSSGRVGDMAYPTLRKASGLAVQPTRRGAAREYKEPRLSAAKAGSALFDFPN